ncbi:hypothetical protein MtrunA17_Chr4g0062721 [Medicago truncatula]|uniref:Uncharacterized protein n=1 Tax=Medicago truncatula TaxID=3880 RepID=A0A396IE35_MEDTR|nr:hypothetical protein MtrunA17_Chr4g0062721 [Medicago truncatula]
MHPSKNNKNEVAKKPRLKIVKLLLAKQKKGGKFWKKYCVSRTAVMPSVVRKVGIMCVSGLCYA